MNIKTRLLLLLVGSVVSYSDAWSSRRRPTQIQLLAAEFEVSPTVIIFLKQMFDDAEKIRAQFNTNPPFNIPLTNNPFSPDFIREKKPTTNEDYVTASKANMPPNIHEVAQLHENKRDIARNQSPKKNVSPTPRLRNQKTDYYQSDDEQEDTPGFKKNRRHATVYE